MLGEINIDKKKIRGASMAEFIIAFPVVIILSLLCLQVILMYRAKLAHNFAVQEAVRIGAMSNGRVVPRFLTDFLSAKLGQCGYALIVKGVINPVTGKKTTSTQSGKTLGNLCKTSGPDVKTPAANNKSAPPSNTWFDKAKNAVNKGKSKVPNWAWDMLRGMMRYGDSSVLQGYINGIMPFYVGKNGHENVASAQMAAYMDAMWNACILYHNPTQMAFLERGSIELQGLDYGILKLPADYMRFRTPLGDYAKEAGAPIDDPDLKGGLTNKSIQDLTILTIQILWSYPMEVPIANSIIIGLAKLYDLLQPKTGIEANFDSIALDRGRFPFSATASARAQNALHWHVFYPLGADAPPAGTGGINTFDAIVAIWNKIVQDMPAGWDPAEPHIGFCLSNINLPNGAGQGETVNVPAHWWGEALDRAAHP